MYLGKASKYNILLYFQDIKFHNATLILVEEYIKFASYNKVNWMIQARNKENSQNVKMEKTEIPCKRCNKKPRESPNFRSDQTDNILIIMTFPKYKQIFLYWCRLSLNDQD